MDPLLIVLLGGIASGKSRVAALFEECGASVLAADPMVHMLFTEDAVKQELTDAFGSEIASDGSIDRARLAARVFGDQAALTQLEQILHPRVHARLEAEIRAHANQRPRAVIVLDVPLAAEKSWTGNADLVVFVDTPEETRIHRAVETRGWTAEDLRAREAHQMPLAEKRALSSHLVHNGHSVAEARNDVRRIWSEAVEPRRKEGRGTAPSTPATASEH